VGGTVAASASGGKIDQEARPAIGLLPSRPGALGPALAATAQWQADPEARENPLEAGRGGPELEQQVSSQPPAGPKSARLGPIGLGAKRA
jgi:hypothetical protein